MPRVSPPQIIHLQRFPLSLFEKVILVNSLMLVAGAIAGLWATSHSLEAHHYLIDTSLIVVVTLVSFLLNVLLMRASFRPLFSLITTMRAVSAGQTHARARVTPFDSEISELASAFNRMLDRLEEMQREQGMLIFQAHEEERRRLALELHDESSQNLTALLVHIEVLQQGLALFPDGMSMKEVRERLREGFTTLTEITQRTLETIRTLSLQLRPSVLDDLGLSAALRWLAEDARKRLHLEIEGQVEEQEGQEGQEGQDGVYMGQHTPAPYETAIFRIAQESLTNVSRHAFAQHVSMTLNREPHAIRLRVQDDGRGYDTSQTQAGLGTLGMRERVALLGGTLTINSHPGKGTLVEAVVPLEPCTPGLSEGVI